MKWSKLSMNDRKQIYSNIRKAHPNVSYIDIKQQFDSIPTYEDGKGKTINKEDLPPEYVVGTPEYFERQKRISGAATVVQPETYLTPAGYIKDALNFVEDLGNKDYTSAAVDAALNLIPFGVGKAVKNIKSKVGRIIGSTDNYTTNSYAEPFTPTITKKGKRSTKPTEEEENNYVVRLSGNRKKYGDEIVNSISDAVFPDEETYKLLKEVDAKYGTDYKGAYSTIAVKNLEDRGAFMSWGTSSNNAYGKTNFKINADGTTSNNISDYQMIINDNAYMNGTVNHELGHIADGLAGSRKITDIDSGREYIANQYLNYLADANNTYSAAELRKLGMHSAASNRGYLLNPTEAKSHMLTLKRSLKDSGKISLWSDKIDESDVLDYIRDPKSNSVVKDQYNLYKNKQNYIDRINQLTPMEYITPIGLTGLIDYESNKK